MLFWLIPILKAFTIHNFLQINTTGFRILLCCVLVFAFSHNSDAREPSKTAILKAAYVYNFINLTSWPDNIISDSQQVISICYSGRDNHFIRALRQLDKKKPTIQVKAFDPAIVNDCHVLVITGTDSNYNLLLKRLSSKPILSISDISGFTQSDDNINGHIELFKKSDKVRFIINRKSVNQSRLKISSQLLKLAIIVE